MPRSSAPDSEPSDLVIALNYYAPYSSGLTNYARDVAEGLAARDYAVTVVASKHAPELDEVEILNGVRVLRAPVAARIGKGVLSPAFLTLARSAMQRTRVVNLHLPMLEAGVLARFARGPLTVTYHCDVSLPPGRINDLQRSVIDRSSRSAIHRAEAVAVTTVDYAEHSRLRDVIVPKLHEVPPPCVSRPTGEPTFRDGPGFHVGYLGRIVEEKGIEYLIDGFILLDDPHARLLIGGDFAAVAGGSVIDSVRRKIGGDPRVRLLGFIPDGELADFYASLDAFALTSINAFEAFGIVQVEAMLAGVPALATDLPGVRSPVLATRFGLVVPPRDSKSIAAGLATLRDEPLDSDAGALAARSRYDRAKVMDIYQDLFFGQGVGS